MENNLAVAWIVSSASRSTIQSNHASTIGNILGWRRYHVLGKEELSETSIEDQVTFGNIKGCIIVSYKNHGINRGQRRSGPACRTLLCAYSRFSQVLHAL